MLIPILILILMYQNLLLYICNVYISLIRISSSLFLVHFLLLFLLSLYRPLPLPFTSPLPLPLSFPSPLPYSSLIFLFISLFFLYPVALLLLSFLSYPIPLSLSLSPLQGIRASIWAEYEREYRDHIGYKADPLEWLASNWQGAAIGSLIARRPCKIHDRSLIDWQYFYYL